MTVDRGLAGIAAGLALLALVAGSGTGPGPGTGSGGGPGAGPGVAELAAELAAGGPVVDAVTLGAWIRDRRPGLRIVDLRDSASFLQYAVPTARHVSGLSGLAGLPTDSEIVLYDDGVGGGGDGGDAARAWLFLRRLGYPRVWILERGLLGWAEEVMSPVLPAHTPEQKARFEEVAAVSRYFGGVPRVGFRDTRAAGPDATREAVQLITRRGCY